MLLLSISHSTPVTQCCCSVSHSILPLDAVQASPSEQVLSYMFVLQAAVCLLMAFKQARHYSPEFLSSFATQSLRQLSSPTQAAEFTPRVVAEIVTSMASHTLPGEDKPSRALVTALLERATEQLEDFDTQACD